MRFSSLLAVVGLCLIGANTVKADPIFSTTATFGTAGDVTSDAVNSTVEFDNMIGAGTFEFGFVGVGPVDGGSPASGVDFGSFTLTTTGVTGPAFVFGTTSFSLNFLSTSSGSILGTFTGSATFGTEGVSVVFAPNSVFIDGFTFTAPTPFISPIVNGVSEPILGDIDGTNGGPSSTPLPAAVYGGLALMGLIGLGKARKRVAA